MKDGLAQFHAGNVTRDAHFETGRLATYYIAERIISDIVGDVQIDCPLELSALLCSVVTCQSS